MTPSNQAQRLVIDFDDEPTFPGTSCQPTQPIECADAQVLGQISSSEAYYRQLSDALDEALNLKPMRR